MEIRLKTYSIMRREFLKANPKCAVFPWKDATEIHHKKGRGKYLNDPTTWLAVSREGHQWIEIHPVEAKEKGWSESRLGLCERCGNVEELKERCSECRTKLTPEKNGGVL